MDKREKQTPLKD